MLYSSRAVPFLVSVNEALQKKRRKRDRGDSSTAERVSLNKKALAAPREDRIGADSNTASQTLTDSQANNKPSGKTFPEKLLEIIENPQNKDVIWWNQAGTAICISPKSFHSQVLEVQFQGTKFDSFARRLTRHGFSRIPDDDVPPGTHVYFHDFFIRGQPELMEQMKGGEKYESPAAKEHKKRRDPNPDAASGMITLSSFYSSAEDASNRTRYKHTDDVVVNDEGRSGNTVTCLPSNEIARRKDLEVTVLNEQANTAAKNELDMIRLNRLNSTIELPMPCATTAFDTLRNETASLASLHPQVQEQLLSQLHFRQNSQQLLLQQHYRSNAQIANELTKRRLLMNFGEQRDQFRGSSLLPVNVLGLPNIDPLLASYLQFQHQALRSTIPGPDQHERQLDAQSLQLQILREKQRQDELLRHARGNL